MSPLAIDNILTYRTARDHPPNPSDRHMSCCMRAMASSPTSDNGPNSVPNEEGLYLSSAHWFRLLQDLGKVMSADEKKVCMEQPKKRWTRKVAYVDLFYPKLYTIASEIHDRLLAYSQHFPNLAKNKASNIHTIGKLIANRQCLRSRVDFHSFPT